MWRTVVSLLVAVALMVQMVAPALAAVPSSGRTAGSCEPATGATKYIWDDVNRMTRPTNGAVYLYRADGMRVKKVTGYAMTWNPPVGQEAGYYTEVSSDNNPTTRYMYDGQMCFEDDYSDEVPTYTVNRYALGARGIDMIQSLAQSGAYLNETGRTFPVYDAHGNMVCTVSRDGTSGYNAPANKRSYDPWGGIKTGSSSGSPDGRYCANLGHKQDDESDLIYIRARYYEPGTGRFISEDPMRQGRSWLSYCENDPIANVDFSGKWFNIAEMDRLILEFGQRFIAGDSAQDLRHYIVHMRVLIADSRRHAQHYDALCAAALGAGGVSKDTYDIWKGLGGEAKAECIIGAIYIAQMIMGVIMREIDELY